MDPTNVNEVISRICDLLVDDGEFLDEDELCHLARSCPDAFATELPGGGYPLHLIFSSPEDDVLLSFQTVKTVYEAFPGAINKATNSGTLPIHSALQGFVASLAVVKFLVGHFPESLNEVTSLGWTPLHYACFFDQPDVIAFLLQSCPEAALKRDRKGGTPLHFLLGRMERCRDIPFEVVQQHLDAAPAAISMRDNSDGRLPVHFGHVSPQVRELLLQRTRTVEIGDIWRFSAGRHFNDCNWTARMQAMSYYGFLHQDDNGDPVTPLHAILQCQELEEERYFCEAIDHFQQRVRDRDVDSDGCIPLHVALNSKVVPVQAVVKLVELDPLSILLQDPVTGFYPFMQASLPNRWPQGNEPSDILNLIYTCFREDPAWFLSSTNY